MKMQRKKRVWSGVILFCTLFFLLSIGKRGFIQQARVRIERYRIQKEIETLQKKKEALEAEKKALDTPQVIEKIAREKYGMAKKNEKVYRVIPKENP